jgi:hypothetical protein
MKMGINMIVFAFLMAYAMSQMNIFGLALSGIGFLLMMVLIEDLEDIEQETRTYELHRKYKQEALWQSKEQNQEKVDTKRSTRGPSKAASKKHQA